MTDKEEVIKQLPLIVKVLKDIHNEEVININFNRQVITVIEEDTGIDFPHSFGEVLTMIKYC